jgi:hypothetical protein
MVQRKRKRRMTMATWHILSRLGTGLTLGMLGTALIAGCGDQGGTEKANAPAPAQNQASGGQTSGGQAQSEAEAAVKDAVRQAREAAAAAQEKADEAAAAAKQAAEEAAQGAGDAAKAAQIRAQEAAAVAEQKAREAAAAAGRALEDAGHDLREMGQTPAATPADKPSQ